MSLRTTMPEGEPASVSTETPIDLPWLVAPLRTTLATRAAHALLLYGSGNVRPARARARARQGMAVRRRFARASLTVRAGVARAAACMRRRSHPDLLVLVPEALRDALGWDAGSEGEEGGEGGKRKPSKDIRVEAVRAAIALRRRRRRAGRGKFVVVHPAERMNEVARARF
jgi:DNA polymerase-3 subunit delta'